MVLLRKNPDIHGWLVGAFLKCSLLPLLGLLGCQSGVTTNKDYGSWAFSGYVIDGYTQKPLPNVSIVYMGEDGATKTLLTDTSGKFFIDALPFGDRSFQFFLARSDSSQPAYTQKIVVASSYSESRNIDGLFGDVSKVVTLYPLLGSLSGGIYIKLGGSENVIPARKVNFKIAYKDTTLANSTPVIFASSADSTGHFRVSNLPLAPGASMTINNYIVNNTTYGGDPVSITNLFQEKDVAMGSLYLTVKDSTQQLYSHVRSNVLSSDGFGLTDIAVTAQPWYILPGGLVSSSFTASFSGGISPNSAIRLSGDTLFALPSKNLPYDTLVAVTITGVDTAGNFVMLAFDGVKRFRTEKKTAFQVRSNVLSPDGFGLSNVAVATQPWYVLPVARNASDLSASITGGGSPAATARVGGDTVFVVPAKRFSYDTLVTVTIAGVDTTGTHFSFVFDSSQRFSTENPPAATVLSNVMSADGLGLTNVPVHAVPWYVLPKSLAAASITVSITGAGNPRCAVSVNGDTVFIRPAVNFTCDTLVTIALSGIDSSGNLVSYTFDGAQRFRTEKGVVAVASNAWHVPGSESRTFMPADTLWVKFSDVLDPDAGSIAWSKSSALAAIYGNGINANARAWVRSDTLFVAPDQRFAVNYGQTMGFKVNVRSVTGKPSDSVDIVAEVGASPYYVSWTNTKDALGGLRNDFGTMDSVVVVSGAPIEKITGLSGISGNATPTDLSLDNVRLRGDTIIYKPSLYLKPDSTYGLDFDVLFKDGALRYDVLAVTWRTVLKIKILSVDNRAQGQFRPLRVIGDSVNVSFSSPINTSDNASIPFRVSMTDVRGKPIRTMVRWDNSKTAATVFNLDTLPLADFKATPAYSADAAYTRAVKSITFDLVTQDGEQALAFKSKNEDIELHTESGLTVVDANFLQSHDPHNYVDRAETPVSGFPPAAGPLRITFSRPLDTAAMRADTAGLSANIGIKEGSAVIPSTAVFLPDAKTITVMPDSGFKPATDYFVWMKNIPGAGIVAAPAINRDAGSFSGKSSGYSLLDKGFQVR